MISLLTILFCLWNALNGVSYNKRSLENMVLPKFLDE